MRRGRDRSAQRRARNARQQLLDFDRDPVAADDHRALRHRHVVGENADLVLLGGIELDDGAAAEAEHLMDRHRGLAQHHGDVDRDIIECRQGVPRAALSEQRACGIVSPRHGYEVVNTRNDLTIGLLPPPARRRSNGASATAWSSYDSALAVMAARAAAIARGEAPELRLAARAPSPLHGGTSARPQELIDARFPVHTTGRGGQFTYHGPGQRVGYVMLDLKRRAPDVRRFVATIEEWIIRTLAAFAVRGERREDRIGVWVRRTGKAEGAEDKIAAIGIRVRHWVTLHGFSLNVAPDLTHFSGIVPCGVSEPRYGVTSLADLGRPASMTEVDQRAACRIRAAVRRGGRRSKARQHREHLARTAQRHVRRIGFALIDRNDARAGRAVTAQLDHREDGFLGAREHRLHRTVAAVAYPAFDAKFDRGDFRPRPIADALHPAADHDPEDHVHPNSPRSRAPAPPRPLGQPAFERGNVDGRQSPLQRGRDHKFHVAGLRPPVLRGRAR